MMSSIEWYRLNISRVIWEQQETAFCTFHENLSRFAETRPQLCKKQKQTNKNNPKLYIYICTYISLTIIINNNKNPSNTRYSWVLHTLKTMVLSILSPDKICLQQCLNIGFSFLVRDQISLLGCQTGYD